MVAMGIDGTTSSRYFRLWLPSGFFAVRMKAQISASTTPLVYQGIDTVSTFMFSEKWQRVGEDGAVIDERVVMASTIAVNSYYCLMHPHRFTGSVTPLEKPYWDLYRRLQALGSRFPAGVDSTIYSAYCTFLSDAVKTARLFNHHFIEIILHVELVTVASGEDSDSQSVRIDEPQELQQSSRTARECAAAVLGSYN